eukprot:CAMPEP_0185850386 /NCGR_PEP_ID=MMETSP1354-20130828/4539_1 /TAXON_ID=708628 /ORGANISM="Erythrolobus madagascarensis, Strain CCMP3276" /LENGTH=124 /DNA_ID=CAMNT_0028551055 /DNA_START=934 /DNA_END=1304 /DNA_ORIENTATION=-
MKRLRTCLTGLDLSSCVRWYAGRVQTLELVWIRANCGTQKLPHATRFPGPIRAAGSWRPTDWMLRNNARSDTEESLSLDFLCRLCYDRAETHTLRSVVSSEHTGAGVTAPSLASPRTSPSDRHL